MALSADQGSSSVRCMRLCWFTARLQGSMGAVRPGHKQVHNKQLGTTISLTQAVQEVDSDTEKHGGP